MEETKLPEETTTHEDPPIVETSTSCSSSPTEYFTKSPKSKRSRHKQELQMIQRALSVSRIPSRNRNGDPPSINSAVDYYDQATRNRSEIYMEFCWCFSCCFASPLCRSWVQNTCPNSRIQLCNIPMYDCLYALLFAPIYKNDHYELTRTQKLIILIRLCFELYKTMIGSYLTIFTPQKCNENICTLVQNLIPRDNMEIVALAMNSIMAFFLLCEYAIEITREKVLRMYFENDPRLPVEKEYFTNLLGILDTKKAKLLSEKTGFIRSIFQLYRRLGIVLLSIYVANICISGAVIYKNYYDRSSFFGFVTNALFIVFKMASILKIAIHSIQIPYSAYIDSPVAFNSLKHDFIRQEVKAQYLFPGPIDPTKHTEHAQYFIENRQYIRFLLENYHIDIERVSDVDEKEPVKKMGDKPIDIEYFSKTRKAEITASLCDSIDIEAPNTLEYCRIRHNSIG